MNDKNVCGFSLDEIKELAEFASEKKLTKLALKKGDCEILIECQKERIAHPPIFPPMHGAFDFASKPAAAPDGQAVSVKDEIPDGNIVKSPIIGTYYSAPAPDKAPFVKIGQNVKKGDVLMIIESMKLMNEIQSEFDGVVKKIFVENGDAVEYDQTLMVIA